MTETRRVYNAALTLDEYRALEAAGKIRRPITDRAIGATTATRRTADAIASSLVTTLPHGDDDEQRPTPRRRARFSDRSDSVTIEERERLARLPELAFGRHNCPCDGDDPDCRRCDDKRERGET